MAELSAAGVTPLDLRAYDEQIKHGLKALYRSYLLFPKTAIRVVQICAPIPTETIHLRMRVVDLNHDPKPHFTALSYTWGPPLPSQKDEPHKRWLVKIGDTLCCVQKNLYDCLEQFSQSAEELYNGDLWIDALCINQDDEDERSQQVNRMAQIYQSADLVLMWLGKDSEDSAMALACDSLQKLAPYIKPGHDLGTLPAGIVMDDFLAVSKLYQRTWFTRVWVIQELLLAKETKFLCGRHEATWFDLAQFSHFIATSTSGWRKKFDREQLIAISAPARLAAGRRRFEAKTVDDDLLYHLIRSRSFKAGSPRDKVYSLLGLIQAKVQNEAQTPLLHADYTLSDSEVYIATAIHILENSYHLLLLGQVEGEDYQQLDGLPSWVPDWSVGARIGLGVTGYNRYHASRLRRSGNLTILKKEYVLKLEGMFLDTTTVVGESKLNFNTKSHPANRNLPHWLDILEGIENPYPVRTIHNKLQSRDEVFWRTLIADTGMAGTAGEGPICPASPKLRLSFRTWFLRILLETVERAHSSMATVQAPVIVPPELTILDRLAKESEPSEAILPTSAEVLCYFDQEKISSSHSSDPDPTDASLDEFEAAYSHSPHLRLFRTAKGYLGLGTTSMREKDTVWIIPGSRIPLIFRKVREPRRYRLVGGAYLHGFMQRTDADCEADTYDMIEVE
ncbi:hypothetical protein FKW77_004484 [Venturia effusa]|uniref:Heterokaryon incompatibility domain-containing protein n=1 Tax=Venturia effusa TaxID=50376 RepID=A0A517LQ03_9PEZI|nr:hypothetical protein FKW77_004484 [Venturia effusa]